MQAHPRIPPHPPVATRLRSQAEAFFVLRRNPLELWGALAYEEDIIDGRFLGRAQMMLNAPDAIRHVLVTNAANYRRNLATHRVLAPILGEGLFLAEGEAWRHQRRTIAPALAPRTMPILAAHVIEATKAKLSALHARTHRPVELLPHLQSLALTIAGQSMFSLEMADFGPELRRLITGYGLEFAQPTLFDLMLPRGWRSPADRGRAAFRERWTAFLDRLIEARLALPSVAARPRDLFDLLAGARDPETGAGFTQAQLRDEVSTMILAGHETTAVTLFWCLYLAARYPDAQAAIAAEAQSAPDDPAALPRTRAHVDEALRLYPPAFLIVREAIGADEIAGRPIAPGTVITISPWVLHRHRRRWHHPDSFDPARFLPGAPPPDRFAYMPFGAGPRICVGASFALTEAVLVLAGLLREFRVDLVGGGSVLPRGIVTTQPDRPVRFVLTPREKKGWVERAAPPRPPVIH
jgi:unspecific monooxygenase